LQLYELIKFEKFLGTIHFRIFCVNHLSNNLTRLIYKRILFYLFYVYGLRTSLFKLREEHKLGMYDNCVPRTICRPKEMAVTGSWNSLMGNFIICTLPNIIGVFYSWFQTFAMFWMLYAFFWVIPWHLNYPEEGIH
jgi:hypothetical protein